MPAGILQTAFGLSDREAIVALSNAGGLTVKETADRLEVSALTVRSQLASAMAKLEVHRRAELVTLLTGLTPGLSTQ